MTARQVLAVVAAICLGACAGPSGAGGDTREVVVSAAASLTDAFADLESAFEAQTPEFNVILNLGGSSALREQILSGAPADVFAPADVITMGQVAASGGVRGEPQIFARNRLEIAVPPGNPAGVTGLSDFADESLLIGLCADGVPCGTLGRRALEQAGVVPAPDTEEPNVRALLTKIEAGELDVGLVYATDVVAAGGRVDGIRLAGHQNVSAEYPIAVMSGSSEPDGAAAFVAFVLSEAGVAVLRSHGFMPP